MPPAAISKSECIINIPPRSILFPPRHHQYTHLHLQHTAIYSASLALYTHFCLLRLYGWSDSVRWCGDCKLRRKQGEYFFQKRLLAVEGFSQRLALRWSQQLHGVKSSSGFVSLLTYCEGWWFRARKQTKTRDSLKIPLQIDPTHNRALLYWRLTKEDGATWRSVSRSPNHYICHPVQIMSDSVPLFTILYKQ